MSTRPAFRRVFFRLAPPEHMVLLFLNCRGNAAGARGQRSGGGTLRRIALSKRRRRCEGTASRRRALRKGVGSRMIEKILAMELGGKVHVDHLPDGVVCLMEAPLPGSDTRGDRL